MQRFLRWFFKFFLLFFTALFVLPAPTAFAESVCTCFCGTQQEGAVAVNVSGSVQACAQTCDEKDALYVGCFADETLFPKNNPLCWTQQECNAYPIKVNEVSLTSDTYVTVGKTYYGTWDEQSPYCTKQIGGTQTGYCYGPLVPTKLNVPLFGIVSIKSLPEYINIVFRFGIPLVAVFAVLIFTISGFQYMTAGGSKSAVAKAKNRMTSVSLGIALLLCVYAIAYLIDPRLTRFNELRPPIVKQAVFIDGTVTCDLLADTYGYVISPTQGTCGTKGKITSDDAVKDTLVNAPKVGDTCFYSSCSASGETCVLNTDGSGGSCLACNEVSDLNLASSALDPGPICGQIQSSARSKEKNPDHLAYCYFDDDFVFDFSSADAYGVDECVMFYTQNSPYVDCNYLRDKAAAADDGCAAYEYMNADSYGWGTNGELSELFDQGSADAIKDIVDQFASICAADECNLASAGKVDQGSCQFVDISLFEEIANRFTGLSAFDNYACAGGVTMNQ